MSPESIPTTPEKLYALKTFLYGLLREPSPMMATDLDDIQVDRADAAFDGYNGVRIQMTVSYNLINKVENQEEVQDALQDLLER